MPIRFGIQTPQEGATYEALATHWREADALGFDSAWLDDHLYGVVRPPGEPQMEAWTLLSALARETKRIELGILVTCNSYRSPALVAKMAAVHPAGPEPMTSTSKAGDMSPRGYRHPGARP